MSSEPVMLSEVEIGPRVSSLSKPMGLLFEIDKPHTLRRNMTGVPKLHWPDL